MERANPCICPVLLEPYYSRPSHHSRMAYPSYRESDLFGGLLGALDYSFRLAHRGGWPRPLPTPVAIRSLAKVDPESDYAFRLFAAGIRHSCPKSAIYRISQ